MAGKKTPKNTRAAAPAKKTAAKGRAPAKGKGPTVATQAQVASPQQIQEAVDRVIEKHDELVAADKTRFTRNQTLGKEITACAKVTGFEKDDIKWALTQRLRKPEEIDAETRRRTRIAGYFNMKIGGQLGLLEDGTSVAARAEKAERGDTSPQALTAAEAQGHQAAMDGANFNSCEFPAGSKIRERWETGWKLGQAKRAESLGGKAPKTPTHTEPAHA